MQPAALAKLMQRVEGEIRDMYENAAMLAVFLLIYSGIAGWIVFTAVGFILGADGLGILRIHIDGEGLRVLAELTLAMVLFTDAANADFSVAKRNLGLPERLLGIGLPLTIVLGFLPAARNFGNGLAGRDIGADRRGARQTGRDQSCSAGGDARSTQSGKRSQRRHLRADCRAVARTGRGHADRGRD